MPPMERKRGRGRGECGVVAMLALDQASASGIRFAADGEGNTVLANIISYAITA